MEVIVFIVLYCVIWTKTSKYVYKRKKKNDPTITESYYDSLIERGFFVFFALVFTSYLAMCTGVNMGWIKTKDTPTEEEIYPDGRFDNLP